MKEKIKTIIAFTVLTSVIAASAVLSYQDYKSDVYPTETTKIRLYGELHGIKSYYDVEYDLWKECYDEGYRNLFLEYSYYTTQYLNIWMKEDNNDILDQLFEDLQGTLAGNEDCYQFFVDIKTNCPETVFYGTDVGHQNETTGLRYLAYLEENGMKDSYEYKKTIECIKAGIEYYAGDDDFDVISPVREKYMADSFIEAYDSVGGNVMGIYGSYHTSTTEEGVMYAKLKEHYGDVISTVNTGTIVFGKVNPYRFGFSITGLIFVLMLFIPNIIWAKKGQPKDYEKYSKNENKVLLVLERIGEVSVTCFLLIFPSTNPHVMLRPEGFYFEYKIILVIAAFVLMILYECYWIKYFRSAKTMKCFYSSFAGFPLAGATLPVIAVFLIAVQSFNFIIIAATIILGIGHIGIHAMHKKEVSELDE